MSRLIDRGPHTVRIWPEKTYTDSYGNIARRPVTTPVELTGCIVTPIASFDSLSGRRFTGGVKLVARAAPLGPWARVEWQGRTYSVASLQQSTASPATTHVTATLSPE